MADRTEQERREDERMREIIERVANASADRAAANAVPKAIETTLKSFGFDTSDPITIQKNQAFLNESRQRCEKFYGDMWNSMTAFIWKTIKVLMIAGAIAILGKLGLEIDAVRAFIAAVL